MKLRDELIENRNEDGTYTLYDFKSDNFFELDEISSYIYEHIKLEKESIVNTLYGKFEVDYEILEKDVDEIILFIKENFLDEKI